jgi:gluconate 2-dehydrogenase gamma chain
MRRREFLTVPAAAIGGTLLYTLAGEPVRLQAQDGTVKLPLRFFTAEEARVVIAACSRIFPSDASGPGAAEAGVVVFIDRKLAGPYGRDKFRYTKGPFVESYPEHGYQGKESPSETYRAGIKTLGDFASLSPADQDAKLRSIEKSRFFQLLRTHTIEGMFSAPEYGGNTDRIGWSLIKYDGDSQPLGYSIFDAHTMTYRERPDKPNSTANPDEDFSGVDANTQRFLKLVVRLLGGFTPA